MKVLKVLFLFILIFLFSCNQSYKDRKQVNEGTNLKKTTIIYRSGYTYYQIEVESTGNGFVKKGYSNNYHDEFSPKTVQDSMFFKVNSTASYFEKLKKYEKNPYKGQRILGVNRIQVYSDKEKVYDSYRFDSDFWSLINTISNDIPQKFNPFVSKI
jgi:hypothetical protein